MSTNLTYEQIQRIEEKRRNALALLAQRKAMANAHNAASTSAAFNNGDSTVHTFSPPSNKTNTSVSPSTSASNQCRLLLRFILISKDRFKVDCTFKADVITIFKGIPSRAYDPKTQRWSFDMREHNLLLEALAPLKRAGGITIEDLPTFIRDNLLHRSVVPHGLSPERSLRTIDKKLLDSLFPFQRDGINFAISRNGRALIADEMGLGKTIQALGIAAYYREEWPLLIVCPSSVRFEWTDAVNKWLPSVDGDVSVVVKPYDLIDARASKKPVIVTSYDMMVSLAASLKEMKFSVVIMDESHFIKNNQTQRCRAATALVKAATRALLLSGTPALSRPVELYTQVSCLRPKLFRSFKEFADRYCGPVKTKFGSGWDYSGASNLEELRMLLEETVMIRRMKCDVLHDLPHKARDVVILDKQSVRTNVKELKAAAVEMERSDLKGGERRGALLKFYAQTAIAKLEAVRSYVLELLASGSKILVFAHHQVVMDDLSMALCQQGYEFIRIDGSTSSLLRKKCCDEFQTKESNRAALLSITAASTGLTLTAAKVVVFAELFWNPGVLIQAEDRVHRVGQDEDVQMRYLVARGTADDYLWPLLTEKLSVLTKAGLSKDEFRDDKATTTSRIADTAEEKIESDLSSQSQRSILDYFKACADDDISVLDDTLREAKGDDEDDVMVGGPDDDESAAQDGEDVYEAEDDADFVTSEAKRLRCA